MNTKFKHGLTFSELARIKRHILVNLGAEDVDYVVLRNHDIYVEVSPDNWIWYATVNGIRTGWSHSISTMANN